MDSWPECALSVADRGRIILWRPLNSQPASGPILDHWRKEWSLAEKWRRGGEEGRRGEEGRGEEERRRGEEWRRGEERRRSGGVEDRRRGEERRRRSGGEESQLENDGL